MTYISRFSLTTIVLSPILLWLITSIMTMDLSYYIQMCSLSIILGCFFAIPTIIIEALLLFVLKKKGKSHSLIKVILSIVAVAGVFISFHILDAKFIKYLGPSIYSVVMVCSIWYFDIVE